MECGGFPPLSRFNLESAAEAAHSKRFAIPRALLLVTFCFPPVAFARYALDRWTVDGGGDFTLTGGFWGVIATAQAPSAPTLSIFRTTANTVTDVLDLRFELPEDRHLYSL